jgi:hypothetical protein
VPRRKDAIFAKVDCKILHGQRYNNLRIDDRAVYLGLWILAVRERSAVLPTHRYSIAYLAHELHITSLYARASIARIACEKLIELMPDGSIIVEGVMDCHDKLKWEQVHLKNI